MNGEASTEMLSANTVIIHPGSLYLRIGKNANKYFIRNQIQIPEFAILFTNLFKLLLGRGCDPNPTTIVHAIARKRLPGGKSHKDSYLIPRKTLNSKESKKLDAAQLQGSF